MDAPYKSRVIILVFLSGCAHQDEWTTGDTVLQGIAFVTMATDAHMTTNIRDHPNIVENGTIAHSFLGNNPAPEDVWMYMLTAGTIHFLVARALPSEWRSFWQVGAIWRHGTAINSGHQIGLFSEPCTTPVPEEFQCKP